MSDKWHIVRFSIRSMNLSCHLHFIRSKHIFLRLCNARLFENGPSKIFLHYHFDEKHYQLRSKNRRNSRPQLQASSCFPGISCPNTFPQAFFSGCLFHRQKQNQLCILPFTFNTAYHFRLLIHYHIVSYRIMSNTIIIIISKAKTHFHNNIISSIISRRSTSFIPL